MAETEQRNSRLPLKILAAVVLILVVGLGATAGYVLLTTIPSSQRPITIRLTGFDGAEVFINGSSIGHIPVSFVLRELELRPELLPDEWETPSTRGPSVLPLPGFPATEVSFDREEDWRLTMYIRGPGPSTGKDDHLYLVHETLGSKTVAEGGFLIRIVGPNGEIGIIEGGTSTSWSRKETQEVWRVMPLKSR